MVKNLQLPPLPTASDRAFINIARIVQDFHTAGLPIWFLQPYKSWETCISCNILEIVPHVNPANILCISEYDPSFPLIYCSYMTNNMLLFMLICERGWCLKIHLRTSQKISGFILGASHFLPP